jgi:YjbR protein
MTPAQFRKTALSFPEAVESAHMDHPDFRVGGKIFATLGYPDKEHGMVVLPPNEQARLIKSHPKVFAPAKGAWGKRGSTTLPGLNRAFCACISTTPQDGRRTSHSAESAIHSSNA